MKKWIFLLLFVVPGISVASDLPPLPGKTSSSPHKLFISSENYQTDSFDVWNIDGGYAYELFDSSIFTWVLASITLQLRIRAAF
jgi:hypothetical protein